MGVVTALVWKIHGQCCLWRWVDWTFGGFFLATSFHALRAGSDVSCSVMLGLWQHLNSSAQAARSHLSAGSHVCRCPSAVVGGMLDFQIHLGCGQRFLSSGAMQGRCSAPFPERETRR